MSEQINGLSRRAFVGGAALFGAVMVMSPGHAFAVSAAEKQAEADAVRNQLVSLQADLEQAANTYYAALEEQEAAEAAMEAEQVKIDVDNERIAELQDRLGSRVNSNYEIGRASCRERV